MKETPPIGREFRREFLVAAEHTISFADEKMPAVLSTPWLIQWMEQTSRESVEPFLEDEERTVGVAVDMRHLAGTAEGVAVVCTSRVLSVDGREITFQIEARDPLDLLARGSHRRAVVNAPKLRDRLARKLERLREATS